MKNLIFVNGTMGAGKTTLCRELKKLLAPSVFLDGDWCWDMEPFSVTDETRRMVMDNIQTLLNRFLQCSQPENHSLWLGDAGTCHCGRGSFRPETGRRVLPAFYPDADGGRASTAAPAGCGRGPSGAGCYRAQRGAAALIRASFHEKHADRRILPFCRGNRPSACLAAGQRPGFSVHSPFDPHPYDPHGNRSL